MNKKVSTLLTCGLMLGGSLLCSSAFAQTGALIGSQVSATDFESGSTYFLMGSGNVVIGMEDLNLVDQTTDIIVSQATGRGGLSDDMDVADNYMWRVTQTPKDVTNPTGDQVYTLTNIGTGKQLLINATGDEFITDYSNVTSADAARSFFAFSGWGAYDATARTLYAGNTSYMIDANVSGGVDLTTTSTQTFSFYSVKDQDIEADDLNKLYNSIGFNFELSDDEIANIFDQEGVRVRAIEVNVSGYSGIKFNENGEKDNKRRKR